MKERSGSGEARTRRRRTAGRAQDDDIIDPYRRQRKWAEPTRCPDCGAVYEAGRWIWPELAPVGAEEHRCPACRRIADNYPAGLVTLTGAFWPEHKPQIMELVRNVEEKEKHAHALNRIMAVEEPGDGSLHISTTDVHLPRRIGENLRRAFHGELDVRYDENNYFTRVKWHRQE